MAKWYGAIGYAVPTETKSGVWEDVITERNYFGDILRNSRRTQSADKLNDDISLNHQISVVADPFALNSIQLMRYVTIMGARWTITDIEIQQPRLILNIGGVYNGPEPTGTSGTS